jgi:peptidoglycan/LPS O-acetylase OafA/YrhL
MMSTFRGHFPRRSRSAMPAAEAPDHASGVQMTATIDSEPQSQADAVIDLRSRDAHAGAQTNAEAAADQKEPQHQARPRLGYQPALDGLRAIAVIAVLLYHADVAWMPGGFLGVDVFFVLSGFLITTLLLEGATALGSPDMKQFYLRRARRLLPAMFAVVLGSTLLVVTVATDDAGNQQRDVPAALTYILNWVYVFTDQSYFEATGRPPMLEHLWSLAVEEQFYLIWPWVFLLAWRMGGSARVRRFALIGAIVSTVLMAVISIMNGYPAQADPSRVYFGTDTHAMGLLVGAALATLWLPKSARTDLAPGAKLTIDAIGALSLLALAVVFWQTSFDSSLLFRGGFLVLSLLVALLIVAATHPASHVGKALGCAPMRYVGTRSYGIYLWHWPIFLVTRPGLDVPFTGTANLLLRFALTFGVAELSYRLLEMPIRRYGFKGAWRCLLGWLGRRGGVFAKAAGRPIVILAVCGGLLGLLMLRLYTLPSEATYTSGVTQITPQTLDQASPTGGEPSEQAVPSAPAGTLGIGESVMIGAGSALKTAFPGASFDASVGRQEKDTIARVVELAAAGVLPQQVFLHMGSNGTITEVGLRRVLDTLQASGVQQIAVVNVSVPRRWQDPNNAIISAVLADYPDVALVDWHAAVLADPKLVVADGIHPSTTGVTRYAGLIKDAFDTMGPLESGQASNDGEPVLQDEQQLRDRSTAQD